MTDLGTYKGRPVLGMRGKLTNTGDGLSESLAIEPADLAQGDRAFILCEVTVEDHTYKRLKDTAGDSLIVTFKADTMTLVDASFAEKYIDEQKEKNLLAREADAGVSRLWKNAPKSTDEPDLVEHHNAGRHAGRMVAGCPECDAELNAMAEEGHGAKAAPKKRGRPRKTS